MNFDGKTAVVTGAASGIGRAIAVMLAEQGARVAAADRNGSALQELASDAGVAPFEFDLLVPATIAELRHRVREAHGVPDILVNAAGWDRIQPFMENPDEFWVEVVTINFLGTVRVTRAFLEDMVAAGKGGKVVNIASDAGRVGSSGEAVYAGAKGGVIALTKSLARELARHAINVNCVCPGPTDTPLFAAQPDRIKEALVKAIPFRRLAAPEEIAHAALFFASEGAGFVTGQVLSVSGGLTMAG